MEKPNMISVRLTEEKFNYVKEVSQYYGIPVSSVISVAITALSESCILFNDQIKLSNSNS